MKNRKEGTNVPTVGGPCPAWGISGSAISGSNQVAISPHVVDVVTDGVGNFIHALGEGYGDLLSRQEME